MSATAHDGAEAHPALVRGFRRWDLVALVVNTIIGAGIFGLPAQVFALAGSYSLVAFGLCAVLNGLVILCFAEVSSRFEETGGAYLYTRTSLGPVPAFEMGWLMWLQRLTSYAAICNLLVVYLAFLWPAAGVGMGRVTIVVAVTAILTWIVLRGVRQSALAINLFTVGKLLPILLFICVGLFFVDPARFVFSGRPSADAISSSVLLLVFAFAGFDVAVIPAAEIHQPRRNLPFAMFTALAGVAAIYTLIQFVCIGTLPGLAASQRPLADAASRFLGAAGAGIIVIGAVVSTTGAMLVTVLAAPRVLYALSEQGQLPRTLSAIHPRFRTPHVAILMSSAVMLVVTLTGSFLLAVTINAMIRLITYMVTCVAMMLFRRREQERPALYRAPAGAAVSAGTLLLCTWLLSKSTGRAARDLAIAAVFGLLLFLGFKLSVRARRSAAAPRRP